MITQPTLEVFGQTVPACRMNEMARRIHDHIAGGRSVVFSGYLWYRPEASIARLVTERVQRTGRKVA